MGIVALTLKLKFYDPSFGCWLNISVLLSYSQKKDKERKKKEKEYYLGLSSAPVESK